MFYCEPNRRRNPSEYTDEELIFTALRNLANQEEYNDRALYQDVIDTIHKTSFFDVALRTKIIAMDRLFIRARSGDERKQAHLPQITRVQRQLRDEIVHPPCSNCGESPRRRNPDNRERELERRALLGDEAAQNRYYASLYRRGALASLVDEQLAEGKIGSAALWYWKERFQEGHDVIFPVTNDSPVSEGYPHHGDTYNVILQHPNQKPPADRFHGGRTSTPIGQRIGDLGKWWLLPLVMFYDAQHQEDPSHPAFRQEYAGLGSRTPGSYYAESLLEDRPRDFGWMSRDPARPSKAERARQEAIGLNFHGGSPEWSIDGPAYAQVLEVLEHVLNDWTPPELPQRHQKILKLLYKEQEEQRAAREADAPKRRLAAKKRLVKRRKKKVKKKRRCGKCRKVGHDRRTCPKKR